MRRRNPGRQADADEGQRVVDQDEHDQHRHGAENVDVADGEPAERLWRVEANKADHQAGGNADADGEQPEQQRVEEAAHQRRKRRHHDLAVEEGVEQSHVVSPARAERDHGASSSCSVPCSKTGSHFRDHALKKSCRRFAGTIQPRQCCLDQALGIGASVTVEESAGASVPNHFLWIACSVPSFFISVSASLILPSSG